jgi:hypothetical protein
MDVAVVTGGLNVMSKSFVVHRFRAVSEAYCFIYPDLPPRSPADLGTPLAAGPPT